MDTVLFVILALGFASIAYSIGVEYNQHNIAENASDEHDEWERFKTTYSKKYDSAEEEEKRWKIFINKLKKIQEHNSKFERGEVTYLQGINQFSDMIPDEVPKGVAHVESDILGSQFQDDVLFYQPHSANVTVPEKVDWRTKGVVTRVKDQSPCNSCWAFSATGALEGQLAIKSKKLVSLSEQDLMDCDTYDGGCLGGGYPFTAFKYIAEHGINSEESYPYRGTKGQCRFNPKDFTVTDKGYRIVHPTEEALKFAVATVGPISVGIDAESDFDNYHKGIFKSSECSSVPGSADHAVLVVGYGTTEKGEDYWLVKNSWGPGWGEEGYIRMARNHNNICGIANNATFPIV